MPFLFHTLERMWHESLLGIKMETLSKILTSVEFWKIAAPVIFAIVAWYLNENSKRKQVEYERKEENYKELLRTLRGFYVTGHDASLKEEFLHQVKLCWLYAPDEVIKKAYEFLAKVKTGTTETNENKELSVGELVSAIRNDLISRKMVKKSKLKAKDFEHLEST